MTAGTKRVFRQLTCGVVGRGERFTDKPALAGPYVHGLATEDVQSPDASAKRDAERTVRERVHAGVQPPVHDGEDVKEQQGDRELVGHLGHRALGVVNPLKKVVEEERDRDRVR